MHFLTRVEKLLDIPPAEKELVMRELRSHYFEVKEELMASGMDESAAEQEAERRLGKPEEVAARMVPVYSVAGWKPALIGVVPYFIAIIAGMRALFKAAWGVGLINYLLIILLSLIVAGTIREFISGRRPIWLATWFAASIVAPIAVLMMLGGIRSYNWSTVAYAVVPCIICMFLVLKNKPKWRSAAVVCVMISVLYVVISINKLWNPTNFSMLMFIVSGLFPMILQVFIALIVFMENRYSNAIQASLFLFAILTIRINRFDTFEQPAFFFYFYTLSILTCIGAWLLCVRSPMKLVKYFAIGGGLILSSLWSIVPSVSNRMYGQNYTMTESIILGLLSVLPFTLISLFVVFTPIIIEHRRKKQRMEAVH